jgi:hypothetical protein
MGHRAFTSPTRRIKGHVTSPMPEDMGYPITFYTVRYKPLGEKSTTEEN